MGEDIERPRVLTLREIEELLGLGRAFAHDILPVWEQQGFRGRNDDGDLDTATYIAAENVNWTQDVDTNFRVRLEVEESAGASPAVDPGAQRLQYNLNGAGWNDVTTTSSVVRVADSPNADTGADNVNRLTTAITTFLGGVFNDTTGAAGTGNFHSSVHDELEFCVQIRSADVNDADTIQLRLADPETGAYAVYNNTPSITVNDTGALTATPAPVAVPAVMPVLQLNRVQFPDIVAAVGAIAAPQLNRRQFPDSVAVATAIPAPTVVVNQVVTPAPVVLTSALPAAKLPQWYRPDGDVANPGGWTDQAGGTTDLWAVLDDEDRDPDNSDYIKKTAAPWGTANYLEVSLTDVAAPAGDDGHIIRSRAWRTGGGTIFAVCNLLQGATAIKGLSVNLASGVWTDMVVTLSEAEAAAITDYSDLRLQFYFLQISGTLTEARFSYGELETFLAPTPKIVTPDPVALTAVVPAVVAGVHDLVDVDISGSVWSMARAGTNKFMFTDDGKYILATYIREDRYVYYAHVPAGEKLWRGRTQMYDAGAGSGSPPVNVASEQNGDSLYGAIHKRGDHIVAWRIDYNPATEQFSHSVGSSVGILNTNSAHVDVCYDPTNNLIHTAIEDDDPPPPKPGTFLRAFGGSDLASKYTGFINLGNVPTQMVRAYQTSPFEFYVLVQEAAAASRFLEIYRFRAGASSYTLLFGPDELNNTTIAHDDYAMFERADGKLVVVYADPDNSTDIYYRVRNGDGDWTAKVEVPGYLTSDTIVGAGAGVNRQTGHAYRGGFGVQAEKVSFLSADHNWTKRVVPGAEFYNRISPARYFPTSYNQTMPALVTKTFAAKTHIFFYEVVNPIRYPDPVAAPMVLPAPTVVVGGQTVSPTPAIVGSAVIAPQLNRLQIPDAVVVASALPAPVVSTGNVVVPDPVSIPAVLGPPQLNRVQFPDPMTVTGILAAPQLNRRQFPDPVGIVSAIPAPTVTIGFVVTPTSVAVISALTTPQLNRVQRPNPVAIPSVLPTPVVTIAGFVTPTAVAIIGVLTTPQLNRVQRPDPALIGSGLPVPFVSVGTVVTPDAIGVAAALPAPMLTQVFVLTPDGVVLAAVLPASVVVPGEATLTPAPAILVSVIPAALLIIAALRADLLVTLGPATLLAVTINPETELRVSVDAETAITVEVD